MKKSIEMQSVTIVRLLYDLDFLSQLIQLLISYGERKPNDLLNKTVMIDDLQRLLKKNNKPEYLATNLYEVFVQKGEHKHTSNIAEYFNIADGIELYIGNIKISPQTTKEDLQNKLDTAKEEITIKINKNISVSTLYKILKSYQDIWNTGQKMLKLDKPKYKEDHRHFLLAVDILRLKQKGMKFEEIARHFERNQINSRNKYKITPDNLLDVTFLKRIYSKYFQ